MTSSEPLSRPEARAGPGVWVPGDTIPHFLLPLARGGYLQRFCVNCWFTFWASRTLPRPQVTSFAGHYFRPPNPFTTRVYACVSGLQE